MRNLPFEDIVKERPDLTPEILVNAISQRVRQLNSGARPLVFSTSKSNAEVALQEILEDKLLVTEALIEMEGETAPTKPKKSRRKK